MYNEAAVKFLSLIPKVCQEAERMYYKNSLEKTQEADSSEGGQTPSKEQHTLQVSPAVQRRTSPTAPNGAIASPHGRSSPRFGRTKKMTTPTLTLKGKAQPPATPNSQLMSLTPANDPKLYGPLSEEAAYFQYLMLAHEEVEACARACHCWSSAYSSVVKDSRQQRAEIQPRGGKKGSGQSKKSPSVGPFLHTVLEKLGSLLALPYQQALLLTSLISRLAQFPQPLLRTYLLRHRLVLREGVLDLHGVRGHGRPGVVAVCM